MEASRFLNPHPPELERFLHASVGEDRRGSPVSVLSALARQSLDPWEVAAGLAAAPREAAANRLDLLLSRAFDVPALRTDSASVGRDLTRLLPEAGGRPGGSDGGATTGGPLRPGLILPIAVALLVLALTFYGGSFGAVR